MSPTTRAPYSDAARTRWRSLCRTMRPSIGRTTWPVLLLVAGLAAPVLAEEAAETPTDKPSEETMETYKFPEVDLGVLSLPLRASTQEKALAKTDVVHDFRLEDRQPTSGIDFVHGIVEDAGKSYKAVHYDHGSGIVVADVDGDGLEDVFFVNQFGENGLYRNQGDGTFEDITASSGLAMPDAVGVTATAADYDNDGDADLFVTTVKMGNHLFENDGKGQFTDVTKTVGLDYVGHSSAGVFFDYDRDGFLDLFLSNIGEYTGKDKGPGGYYIGYTDAFDGHLYPDRTERSILYRNVGGERFVDASTEAGLVDVSWTGDATFTDLDADGYPELYVLNMQGDDHFYVGEKGKKFVDQRAERFPKTPWGAMGVGFFDFDNDGDQDLYLTDMHSDMFEHITPDRETLKSRVDPTMPKLQGGEDNIFGNAFYVNEGDGAFAERSDALGVENYWPWGFSVGDVNADGYEDLFVASSMNYPFRYGANSLFLNDGGERFHDAAFVLGAEPRADGATHTPWFTLDCSGADAEHEHCAGREGEVQVLGALGTRSSVFLDIENDGDLDLITNEMGSPPMVLVSNLAQEKKIRYLALRLVGSTSNRDGLGAIVTVEAGDMKQTQVHDGKSGYLSQSRMPLYFGLGDAETVDRITVRWPSGTVQTMENVAGNQALTIEEPKEPKKETPAKEDAP